MHPKSFLSNFWGAFFRQDNTVFLESSFSRRTSLLFTCFVFFDVTFVGFLLLVVVDAHKQQVIGIFFHLARVLPAFPILM